MAPALARTTGSRFGCTSPCALFETKSAPLQKPSLFWGSSRVHVSKVVQNGRRLGIRCQTEQSSTSACAFTFGRGPSFSRKENAEHGKLPRRDVSVAARKSRSMREMEDEEEGFQSLVKQMQSQQKKPPSAPAPPSTPKGPDPYAEFSALLDYQDQNDGLLPPSRNPRPATPSPNTPRPVEPVKPRVISRAGAKIAGLSGLKVPTPRPVIKKGAYSVDFSTYDEPIVKIGVPTPVTPLGGATEYKLGDSGAVQVTPQGDFPVRLKGHKMPKRGAAAKKPDVNLEAPVEVPAVAYDTPSQAETESESASGLAALQAGGLGSANPKANQDLTLESFVPGRGKEYTLSEEGSDVSIASASSFPVRTKSHREPKGGYSTGADLVEEKKPEPKKPTKRVPSYQELVSGTTKIADPTIQAVPKLPVLESKIEEVSASQPRTGVAELGADISGPRVYTLGEDDGSVSVEPAESIPVRLKALKVRKVAGSSSSENEKEKPKKVAQRVPGFQLPSDVRESGLLKKKTAMGARKESDFRPVAAPRSAPADLSGGIFANAKRFLTSRGVADAGSGADVAQQAAELREAMTSALTSAQAEVLKRAIAVVERKALAEAQGALIVPVVEGKKKVKGKKERAQITAAFPKWKEDYERVCIDADYTLRQLDGLAVELGRSQQSEENERGRRKGRAERADEAAKVHEGDVRMATPAVGGLEKNEKTARAVDSATSDAAGARAEASRSAGDDVSTEAPAVVESQESGALVVEDLSAEERSVEENDGVDLGTELGDDELPNWEDDPEDIDLSAYESDSDDEQPEGEAKPEFEVRLPPPRAATTEFREDDAYATFAAMLGDDESDNDEEDTELFREETASRSKVDEAAEEGSRVNESENGMISPSDDDLEELESSGTPDTLSDASPSAESSEESAEPAAWDRERLSSQIFELLRGTTEGEKKQFGREAPTVRSSSVRGPAEQGTPSLATLESVLRNEKRSDSVRTSVDSVRTPTGSDRTPEDSVGTPMGSVRTPPEAVRTASDASEWSEEVQSAVAKAEAEREMARKRRAPDYGTFEELLKEEDGVKSEKPTASAPSSEELARVTRPPTLKDQRAPFIRDAKPLKPAVPTRGPSVPSAADPSLVKKPRWVRVWDVDNSEVEDATAKEWARAEALCPNKESVEVLVVNHNSGGLQVLFGTLLGFIPASQLSLARRPPRSPEWMTRALTPKDLRNLPRSGTAQRTPLGGEKQQSTVDKTAPVDVPDESADSAGEDEVDYVTSGIIPETDEQLAIAARQVRAYRTAHLASLVGQRLTVKIIVADRAQKKLIFSERSILWKEGHEEAMSKLLARIKIGDIVRGTVKAIMKYGAFIEVDGASCLIHKSELAWVQPKHPGELLQSNQEVEAVVVGVDRAIGRVNCSLKRLQPDPLTETLDSLVERAPAEGEESILTEMPELGDVIALLKAAPGVGEVRLGRRFRGTAFAPSFQIFLSEKVDNGYRLLARVGVEVQEVLVTTELERDTMKQVVRDATVSNSSERRLALADFAS